MPESSPKPETSRRTHHHFRTPNIVSRFVGRRHKAPGSAPGTLVHTGKRKVETVRIQQIDYDVTSIDERTLDSIEACFSAATEPPVTWVNVDGLHDIGVLEAVGEQFGVHRLALEDVLSTNQRAKVEEYENHVLIILKMLTYDRESLSIEVEQVSLILGPTWLFSFQERFGDVFEPVRERLRQAKGRLRSRGTDYLAYALIDAIVDSYFQILEQLGDEIEVLEDAVLGAPNADVVPRIHALRRETLVLRRAVWPLREALGQLYRGEIPLVTEETRVFLRDVYDHTVQVIDTVETLREVLSSAMDLHMSAVSNRMNEVMKVLTIIATIFIPLSFFAGLYGMNFQYMPELGIRWAYPALLAFMVTLSGFMLWYFKRKGWIGG